MRLGLFFILLFCSFKWGLAQGRNDNLQSTYKNTLKLSLSGFGIGSLSVHKEKSIDPNHAIALWGYACNYLYGNEVFAFGVGAGYRSYFKGQQVSSLFAEPYLRYQYFMIPDAFVTINTLSAGFVGGHRWLLGNRVILEFYFGPSLNFGSIDEGNGSVIFPDYLGPLNGVAARVGFNLGYRY